MDNPHRSLIPILMIATFLAVTTPISSQGGSLDTWVEACEATDSDLLALLENEALIVGSEVLHNNGDGTYTLDSEAFTVTSKGYGVCTSSRFYGQPKVINPPIFRSAVQVGRRLVLTAWHHTFNPADFPLSAVFGLKYTVAGNSCLPPDFDHIPAANVYQVTEVVADGLPNGPGEEDFLLVKLDRDVSTTYPRVRRSGRGRVKTPEYAGDRLTLIGHPERLAAKVDLAGNLVGYSGNKLAVKDLHAIAFNSGSMVYNRDEKFLETVVSSGGGASWVSWPTNCKILTQFDFAFHTNVSLALFAEHIPAFELLVTPLDTVIHDCTSGTCTIAQYDRTIGAPSGAGTTNIDYEIHPPQGTAPTLVATFGDDLQGTLTPGESFGVQETVVLSGGECGTHERTYAVRDQTHGFEDIVRHIFEFDPCSP